MNVVPAGQLVGTVVTGGSLQSAEAMSQTPRPLQEKTAQPVDVPQDVPAVEGA